MSSNKKCKEISLFLPFSSTAFSLSAILNNYYGHMTYNWNHVTFFVDFFFSLFLEVSHYHYHAWIIIKLGGKMFCLIGATFFYDLITWNDRVFLLFWLEDFTKMTSESSGQYFFLHAEGFFSTTFDGFFSRYVPYKNYIYA